jgi:hypothetical protein
MPNASGLLDSGFYTLKGMWRNDIEGFNQTKIKLIIYLQKM